MFKVALGSFPFLGMDETKAISLNSNCRLRMKEEQLCSFVNLCGHSLSCALVLAILVDSVEEMKSLGEAVEDICKQLERISEGTSGNAKIGGIGIIARDCAKSLKDRLNKVDCPDNHPIIKQVTENVVSVADVRRTVEDTHDLLSNICEYDFSNQRNRGKIPGFIEKLQPYKEEFIDWQKKLGKFRKKIVQHIQKSRYYNLSVKNIPMGNLESELGKQVKQMIEKSGLWPQDVL